MFSLLLFFFFFFNDTATTEIYTLSLHDALPIFGHTSALLADESSSPWAASVKGALPNGQDSVSEPFHLAISRVSITRMASASRPAHRGPQRGLRSMCQVSSGVSARPPGAHPGMGSSQPSVRLADLRLLIHEPPHSRADSGISPPRRGSWLPPEGRWRT